MASQFLNRGYHNKPEKTELYQKIAALITASHSDLKDDLQVLTDLKKDVLEAIKSIE